MRNINLQFTIKLISWLQKNLYFLLLLWRISTWNKMYSCCIDKKRYIDISEVLKVCKVRRWGTKVSNVYRFPLFMWKYSSWLTFIRNRNSQTTYFRSIERKTIWGFRSKKRGVIRTTKVLRERKRTYILSSRWQKNGNCNLFKWNYRPFPFACTKGLEESNSCNFHW